MKLSVIDKALDFATVAHKGQFRKYTKDEYITHPIAVSEIVRKMGGDDNMIAAALLHDVVEDCDISIDEILENFGDDIAILVDSLTNVSKFGDLAKENRAVRKEADRVALGLTSARAQTIKLADIFHNTISIVEHDPKFAKVFLVERRALIDTLTRADPAMRSLVDNQDKELSLSH